ncbi:hypothetical protein GL279_06630 [Paracoccus limosus]|uniref:Mitochondrial inner membrane protein n=1 Tax=Paracoccus limosus TaxID=913252 RepID=A0A844H713_9RHOB|nr:hypothetical protein [Paracoccus limosus]MTH34277.1 hypothetical protein [Paracoccus limosus]
MTEQDKTSSQDPATPAADAKRQPVAGAAIESRATGAGDATKPQDGSAKPVIDSTLVGSPDPARPAAAKKPAGDAAAAKPATVKPGDSAAAKAEGPAAKPAVTHAATPSAAPVSSIPVSTRASAQPAPRRVGFFPTFLGGVVAAGLGAAACYWVIPHLPAAWQPVVPEAALSDSQLDAARQAGVDAARAEFQTQADALATRAAEAGTDAARQVLADATPGAASATGDLPADLADKLAALERNVADLGSRLGQQAPAGIPQSALDALASRVEQQQSRLDELAARPAVDPATAAQVQTLAQQAEQLQQSTEAANRRAQAAAAASALIAAIENGAPRDQALAELQASGVEVPAVLTADVPRIAELRSEFPAAARAGLKAARDSASGEGTMSALGNFLRVQTGARSVEPREGSDPDAVLSRANAAVESGDIAGALAEIGALPQPAQEAMAQWVGRAKTWTDANAALAALAAGGR